jgi:hypothetical protein
MLFGIKLLGLPFEARNLLAAVADDETKRYRDASFRGYRVDADSS